MHNKLLERTQNATRMDSKDRYFKKKREISNTEKSVETALCVNETVHLLELLNKETEMTLP